MREDSCSCGKKEDPMTPSEMVVNRWLVRNRGEMIVCPNQPGQLRISKSACAKRYRMGSREDFADLMKGDPFHYAYKRGLTLCRECRVGKKCAATVKHP